ncbi:MFS transporter [Nocardia yunnanensis]|uniref:MFS transporter n=1 Tax=Nocardia yunnanensis TaxID=2382165 RepID=A0A386ZL18_9NOCA|nr:MFS transporter [Nocardia yunnanensis]AYF78271.1 MFS transporter [Nocardia yunnanensis]
MAGRSLGREFGWLWAAFAVSTAGSWLAFDAFPLIAVLALHAGPGQVSLLAAAGLAVGAVLAVPLGPWMEFRRKRPVMIATDVVRCAVVASVPVAYALGALSFAQLLVVAVLVAASDLAFKAASGAYLKSLVAGPDLLVANGRFESTMWTASVLGPPLGGAAIGIFGPVITTAANAVSFLLSAWGIRAIGGGEAAPASNPSGGFRPRDLAEGWRYILSHRALRPLFLNTVLVNGLIMATAPLLAVIMLRDLGFAPWQYGLAFSLPCLGGLLGSRLAAPLSARFGARRVLLVSGVLRACWSVALAGIGPGLTGLLLVMAVEFGLITCCGIFNPVYATYRLENTAPDRVTRTLSAWSITGSTTTAALTALWGLLAALVGSRTAIGAAGVLMLATVFLLRPSNFPVPDLTARTPRPAESAPR